MPPRDAMDERIIFEQALERPEAERLAFIRESCDGDQDLARRIERLVVAHHRAETAPVELVAARAPAPTAEPPPPEWVDSYRVLERLGEGGMGVVFLAEQTRPVRRLVAIKILKSGVHSREVVARFHAERQALAIMDHPGIATVYDAGTMPDGRPYFVMEYVRGEPITEYCDRMEKTVEKRLELFEQVCHALHHAHQKGVIHRDIKPNNTLVTTLDGRAIPKIIDFGIAKATEARLTEETINTLDRHVLGTPEYMSPEQASTVGADVDTRSDIYSLGVMLYRLLVGRGPYDETRLGRASLAELERMICEDAAPRPSSRLILADDAAEAVAEQRRTTVRELRRKMRGDLDWIVMRSIEKDRARRYATVFELAADVRRFLDGEAVEAGPPSRVYRLRKFYHRHRPLAIAGIVTAATLVIATIVSLFFGVSAVIARNEAIAHQGRATADKALAQHRLWDSYLAQARAARASRVPGRREDSLAALTRAAAMRPSPRLRDEAIACMALTDVVYARSLPNSYLIGAAADIVAFGDEAGGVVVRSVHDGRTLHELEAAPEAVTGLLVSSDGRFLEAKQDRGERRVMVWDLHTEQKVLDMEPETVAPGRHAFGGTSDAPWLAMPMADGRVQLFDLSSGAPTLSFPCEDDHVVLEADPTGARLAAARFDAQTIEIWDLETGTRTDELAMGTHVYALAWREDGRFLAAGGSDGAVHMIDPATRVTEDRLIGHQAQVVHLSWLGTTGILVSGAWDSTVRLWNTDDGQEMIGPIDGHFIGLGANLVTRARGRVTVWDCRFSDVYRQLKADAAPLDAASATVAFASDGRHLFTGGAYGLRVWDVAEDRIVSVVTPEKCRWIASTPDGRTIVTGHERSAYQWTVTRGTDGVPSLELVRTLFSDDLCKGIAIDSGGRHATVSSRREVRVIDLETGAVTGTVPAYRGIASSAALSANGRFLFTGTWKGAAARLFDLETGEDVLRFDGEHVTGGFSPDGTRLTVTFGNRVLILRTGDWQEIVTIARDYSGDLASTVAYTPDGSLVAVKDTVASIMLVDPRSGERVATLANPHRLSAQGMAFDPQGRRLAIGTRSYVQVWDLGRAREVLRSMALDWAD
jgi:serine/threonine protein kinase/WD40 repeat protein